MWTPVCYASRSLTECEQGYSQREEAPGVVFACERFHAYVYEMKFVVETDHKPLKVIYGPRSRLFTRIERWFLRFAAKRFQRGTLAGARKHCRSTVTTSS